ncbi:hypothetical protein GCM10010363_74980 [Streptomyces omiyaensis]|nr:hypothetical protein GCM10010363_74980 [Streptomyces omiyaensis]
MNWIMSFFGTPGRLVAGVAASLLLALSIGGCATLEDTAEKYPRNAIKDSAFLSREWTQGDSSVRLDKDGTFVAKRLYAEYFDCPPKGPVGPKSGEGSWTSRESEGSTAVFLDFRDGCAATFWLGEFEGAHVIWTDFEVDDALVRLHG